jgi:hypothetical protein
MLIVPCRGDTAAMLERSVKSGELKMMGSHIKIDGTTFCHYPGGWIRASIKFGNGDLVIWFEFEEE